MEVIFKNRYTRNRELIGEIYRYYFFKRRLWVFFDVIMIASFLVNLVSAFAGQDCYVAGFVLAPLCIGLQFVNYFRQLKLVLARDKEVYGKEIEVETTVSADVIRNVAVTGAVNEVGFNKIRWGAQTKNLIFLTSEARLIYIFKKDGFEVGTPDEFIAFLKTKGITVKGKR